MKVVKGRKCLNCDNHLIFDEDYCPKCGQKNNINRLSVKEYLSHLFLSILVMDNKLLRTFKTLIFQPGKVSKEYIAGKRSYYSNPFQMLLQTSVIFFLIIGLIQKIESYSRKEVEEKANIVVTKKNSEFEKIISEGDKAKFEKEISQSAKQSNLINKLNDNSISQKTKDDLIVAIVKKTMRLKYPTYPEGFEKINFEQIDTLSNFLNLTGITLQSYLAQNKSKYQIDNKNFTLPDSLLVKATLKSTGFKKFGYFIDYSIAHKDVTPVEALKKMGQKPTKWNLILYQKATDFRRILQEEEFRDKYFSLLLSKISLGMLFMLPLFTFFFNIVFYNKKYNYSENLVTVFNIQTAFFVFLVMAILLDKLFLDYVVYIILFIGFFIYLLLTIRNMYQKNKFLIFVKTIFLTNIYFILSGIVFAILLFFVFLF